MLCFCVELIQILFYLKGLMTHMADPESCSVSVRLPDNQGGLAYYKCRRVLTAFNTLRQLINESIRSKWCSHKNQKQYYSQKNSYYINEKNKDKEDEINIYNDVNNVGDNSGNNNDEN